MVQSVLAGQDINPGTLTSQKNITTDIYEFSCFEKFIDFFRENFTGESLIDAYREIHTLLLSEHAPSSHDIVGERFHPILGLVKMLDITPENKRGFFKVSISPQSDEHFNIRVHYRGTPLIDGVITSDERTFLEKNLFNKNNGEITYPTGIDNNTTLEGVFLSAYKEYAKKSIEQEMQEIIINMNDIIMHSATRDHDEIYRNKKTPQHKIPYIASHYNVVDIGREGNNLTSDKRMLHVLKHNTGNCGEMNSLSAMLMVAILEKRIHTLNLNANTCNNIDVSMLVTPWEGMDGHDEGCDYIVANLCFNFYGVELKYIVDPWGRRFFEYESKDDIKNNYSDIIGNSTYLNENVQWMTPPIITAAVNDENNINMLKKHMYEIHNVNLDDTNPFRQERDRREAALANRFRYGSGR